MKDLLLTDQTRTHLQALAADPPHALLLVGPTGMGKREVAKTWAHTLTQPEHVSVIEPDDKSTISIESVRQLYQHTRSKQHARQVVVIHNAQCMGIEAQNAFLKLLEEPNPAVTFVLTAPTAETLLPTIASRVQTISLPRIANAQLEAFALKQQPGLNAKQLAQLLFVADGRPGTLVHLLQNPATFDDHKAMMQQAKHLLAASTYERLAAVNDLVKDRQRLVATLEAMGHMLHLQIMRDPQPKLLRFADGLEQCLVRLAQNGNPRAQLTALFAG